MNKNIIANIKDAKIAYDNALKNHMNVTAMRERLVNTLMSNVDDIVDGLESVDYLTQCGIEDAETIRNLKKQLADSDAKDESAKKKG